MTRAITEMQQAGICRDCPITIVAGPDEYLFGEEKAMLEVIEGNDPLPGGFPPYEHGLFATAPQTGWEVRERARTRRPPRVEPDAGEQRRDAVERPHILARGADWFRSMGTAESPGNVVATVVGDVVAPDVGEVELGTPLRAVLDAVGSGVAEGRTVKAVFSGVANPVITARNLDVPLSYEGLQSIGSGMGAAGFIVYDDTACMVEVARRFSRFLYVESCGQCPPCKQGSGAITERLERVEAGTAQTDDLAEIGAWLDKVTDGNRCFLAVEEQRVVGSILRRLPRRVRRAPRGGTAARPRPLPFPKLVDLHDGVAVYDGDYWRKQPDWTYLPA